MKILIKAKPNAKIEKIEQIQPQTVASNGSRAGIPTYKVSVKATPTDGKANDAIIRALAQHFGVRINNIRIVSGHTANQKIVEITS